MKSLVGAIIWWPKLDEEIKTMVCSCSTRQTQHDSPPAASLIPWKWASHPYAWSRLHLDYIGPFLGHMWLLIIAQSKWLKIFQITSTSFAATIHLYEMFM